MSLRTTLVLALLLLAAQAAILFALGQPGVCECGVVKLWEGALGSNGTSQQVADWYTFSHVIHGFAFFGILWLLFPRFSIYYRFLIAVALEVGWEILENTPMVIEHYRQQALAAGYVGDSVLNSISDTASMVLGFLAAVRLPVWGVVLTFVLFEAFTMYMIRDGLLLNIMGFVYVFPGISEWQSAL